MADQSNGANNGAGNPSLPANGDQTAANTAAIAQILALLQNQPGGSKAAQGADPNLMAAAAAAALAAQHNNGAMEFNTPIVFYGDGGPAGATTPQDFLGAIKTRQDRFNWSDEHAARQAVTSLQGEASVWFKGALPMDLSDDDYQRANASFLAFTRHFCRHYQTRVSQDLFYSEDLQPQRSSETAKQYMTRIRAAFTAGTRTASSSPIHLPQWSPVVAALPQEGLDEIKRVMLLCKREAQRLCNREMMRFIIRDGLSDKRLRQLATDKIDLEMGDFVHALEKREADSNHIHASKNDVHKRETKIASRTVYAMDDDSSADDDEEVVDAITKKKKKKKQAPKGKGAKGKGGAANAASGNGKMCSYCNKANHVEAECFKKKRDDKAKAERSGNSRGTN